MSHVVPETDPPPVDPAPIEDPPTAGQRTGAWALGALAFIALIAASIISVGLASIVWVPLLFGIGVAMVAVWGARRKRQVTQGRNADEIKDPTHAHPHWPANVTDDRLPEP